jgi:spermidine/putrescine transport system substrate-binding protein
MKNQKLPLWAFFLGITALFFLQFGCGPAKPRLHVYNWADYLDEDVIKDFEETHGCRVILDFFDSNESMYAKVKAGAAGYDVIFPSSYQAAIMKEEGLLQNLDPRKIPNLGNIDPAFLMMSAIDATMTYSVPYMTGTTGIAYRAGAVSGEMPESWSVFLRPEFKNRATLLNDPRETIGAALKSLGYSVNATDEAQIAAAAEVVIQWKRNIAKFENEQYKPGIASGEFLLVHGYSGDISQVIADNEEAGIQYMLPEEGFTLWCDDMVIPAKARNPDLAHAFINFMLEPKVAARNMEFCFYKAPNQAAYALLSEDLREDKNVFVPKNKLEKAEVLKPLGAINALYSRYWDRIKAAN